MAIYVTRRLIEATAVLFSVLVVAQAGAEIPRTPWGAPDLNGVWKFSVASSGSRHEG